MLVGDRRKRFKPAYSGHGMSTITRSHDPGRVVLMMRFSSPSASRRLAAITMNHANGARILRRLHQLNVTADTLSRTTIDFRDALMRAPAKTGRWVGVCRSARYPARHWGTRHTTPASARPTRDYLAL